MFENKVLRKIYGPKRDEMTGEWKKQHNEELHGLYDSLDVVRIMKLHRLRWVGHVARMGEKRRLYSILVQNSEGKYHWEDRHIVRRTILEGIFMK